MVRCKGTVCKKTAHNGRQYCKIHNMGSPEVPLSAEKTKSYSKNNENKIKKIQTLYKKEKKKKNAVKTISNFRSLQLKREDFKTLQTARKIFRNTHENIAVTQPKRNVTKLNVSQCKLNKPKFNVVTPKFKPKEQVATFFNENGKPMQPPIPLSNVKYYTRESIHPVNWQKFGKRPTEPLIQPYEVHMLSTALNYMKNKNNKPINMNKLSAVYNNTHARDYVKDLFRQNQTTYSKTEIKRKIINLGFKLKVGEEVSIYFKYPIHIQPQYNTKGIEKQFIFKVDEPLKQLDKLNKTRIITRIKIKNITVATHWDSILGKVINAHSAITYTLYYGKGERGHFEYIGRPLFL